MSLISIMLKSPKPTEGICMLLWKYISRKTSPLTSLPIMVYGERLLSKCDSATTYIIHNCTTDPCWGFNIKSHVSHNSGLPFHILSIYDLRISEFTIHKKFIHLDDILNETTCVETACLQVVLHTAYLAHTACCILHTSPTWPGSCSKGSQSKANTPFPSDVFLTSYST